MNSTASVSHFMAAATAVEELVDSQHQLTALSLVLCEYSKFRIESNSYFSIWFDSKRAQLFKIFEYLLSPISYLFIRMTPIFYLSNHA